jgi:hypothetical protein
LLAALLDISMPSATGGQDSPQPSAEVDPREADDGDGAQHRQ